MHISQTVKMTMKIIFVLMPCVTRFCIGVDVGLTLAPSAVTEGGSLTLTCTVTQNRSLFASFNFVNWTRIGIVKLLEGRCVPSVRNTDQFCNQQCSCDTNGKSFSWTITNVTSDWNNTQIRCYMVTPDVTTSTSLVIHVLRPNLETTSSSTDSEWADISTNVLVISLTCAVVLVTAITISVTVFYCRRKRRLCFSREDNNLNQARGTTQQSEPENGEYQEICQTTTYEDLNLDDVAPSSEYDNVRCQGQRSQAEKSNQNTYESLGQTSAPDLYDDLVR